MPIQWSYGQIIHSNKMQKRPKLIVVFLVLPSTLAAILIAIYSVAHRTYSWDLRKGPSAIAVLGGKRRDGTCELVDVRMSVDLPTGLRIDDVAQNVFVEVQNGLLKSVTIRFGPKTDKAAYQMSQLLVENLKLSINGRERDSQLRLESWHVDHSDLGQWPNAILGSAHPASGVLATVVLRYSFLVERPWLVEVKCEWN